MDYADMLVKIYHVLAAWFTWVRDVLCMADDLYSKDIK